MDLENIKLSEKTCLENENLLLHIYEVSKVVKFIVVENKIAIAKTAGGRNELFNGHKLSVILSEKNSSDLLCNITPSANNTVLCTKKKKKKKWC